MAQCLKTKTSFSQTIKKKKKFPVFYLFLVRIGTQLSTFRKVFFLFLECFSEHQHTLTVITTTISYCSSWSSYSRELAATVEVLAPPAQEFSAVLAPPAQEFGDQLLTQHSIQQFKQKILFCTIFHKQSSFLLHKFFFFFKSHNLTIPKNCKTIKLYLTTFWQ